MVMAMGMAVFAMLGLAACGPDPPDAPTIATLADFSLHLSATPIHTGTNQLLIYNNGDEQHELVVFKIDQPVEALALTPEGDLNEEVLTNVSDGDNVAPKTTATRTVDLTEAGTYLFVCNLPGHFKKGMFTTVTLP